MSNLWFRLMAAEFKIRDALKPRIRIIEEVGIREGFKVLDFGCGPGGYVLPATKLVGEKGKLYALDAMPTAINMVKKIIKKNNLKNVETILSNLNTELLDNIIDVALLYDVFHDLENQRAVLQELHRVLKPSGTLSFSDHHMNETSIISAITSQSLFKLLKKGTYTYSFIKI
jgi:ubiquinone/menaquinone biosynthesis C-methylase UbiE